VGGENMREEIKKLLSTIGGGIVGFIEGLILGPFSAIGHIIALLDEAVMSFHYQRQSYGCSIFLGLLLGIGYTLIFPLWLVPSMLYKAYYGACVGAKKGFLASFGGVFKELFTYDTLDLTEEEIRLIPENKVLVSYRAFFAPSTPMEKEHFNFKRILDILIQGQRDKGSILSRLPHELILHISSFTTTNLKKSQLENICLYYGQNDSRYRFKIFDKFCLKSQQSGQEESDDLERERRANTVII
jgi:hypothetical protein